MRWRDPEAARLDASLARLAVPAFLALVAEPLFLIADSAIVGHLGTRQLAGLGVAAAGGYASYRLIERPLLELGRTLVTDQRLRANVFVGSSSGAETAGFVRPWPTRGNLPLR